MAARFRFPGQLGGAVHEAVPSIAADAGAPSALFDIGGELVAIPLILLTRVPEPVTEPRVVGFYVIETVAQGRLITELTDTSKLWWVPGHREWVKWDELVTRLHITPATVITRLVPESRNQLPERWRKRLDDLLSELDSLREASLWRNSSTGLRKITERVETWLQEENGDVN